MVKLGVNIDHVATVRQQRLGEVPNVLEAALLSEKSGADGITVHLREDRRHIQDEDVKVLKRSLTVPLNLEMSVSEEIVRFACQMKPAEACLVPEKRRELTTEGGLDVLRQRKKIQSAVARLKKAGVEVSLFIDPDPKQVLCAKEIGADAVELHTGSYADAPSAAKRAAELRKLRTGAEAACRSGLILNAGHGLDLMNVGPVAAIPGMNALNIGFSIVARSIFVGLGAAVREMKLAIRKSRTRR